MTHLHIANRQCIVLLARDNLKRVPFCHTMLRRAWLCHAKSSVYCCLLPEIRYVSELRGSGIARFSMRLLVKPGGGV